MLAGSAQPSLADTHKITDSKVTMPTQDGSNRYVRRLQVWALIIIIIFFFLKQQRNRHAMRTMIAMPVAALKLLLFQLHRMNRNRCKFTICLLLSTTRNLYFTEDQGSRIKGVLIICHKAPSSCSGFFPRPKYFQ